jgi:hypothetical protein
MTGAWIVIVNELLVTGGLLVVTVSVARTEKLKVPLVLGVPDSMPLALSVRPGGSAPDTTEYV